MQASVSVSRKAASVPLGHLSQACLSGQHIHEVLGQPDRTSHPCFSPVFDLELDAKLASQNHLDRCFSQQQLGGGEGATAGNSLLQQILALCRCASPVQVQLLQHLQRLRSAAYAASSVSSGATGLVQGGSSHSADAAACVLEASAAAGGSNCHMSSEQLDIEAMACELLAMGYMVQVRDGQQQQDRSKTPRSCLQNLRHRFIVCLGTRSAVDGEPAYLPEPLVVEPRFREQFIIAHPTPEYEALLQSVPPCFVGPVVNLEGVVKVMCEQMYATFKLQGLPVPPWRTRTALLSKWSPPQLAELAAKIASTRRIAVTRAIVPCQSHERLYNDDRPAAAHAAHAAVGSAPSAATHGPDGLQAAAQEGDQPQDTAGGCPAVNSSQRHTPGAEVSCSRHAATKQAPTAQHPLQPSQQRLYSLVTVAEPSAAAAAACVPSDEQPSHAVGGVLALLSVNTSTGSASSEATLKFTRKASAEWKHHRSHGRKTKGLLAAALNKSVSGSRSNLFAAPTGAVAGEHASSQPTAGCGPQGSSVADGQLPAAAALGQAAGSGSDAFIRRTHFRAAGDEPWRRITTVRMGAFLHQPRPQ